MIDLDKVRSIAEGELIDGDLFVVDVICSGANEIEITIDSDKSVDISSCIAISRAVDAQFEREEEDFQLTVSSAGVGQPLKIYRQYIKLIGKSVEVVLKSGVKVFATLSAATEDSITLSYTEMRAVEGKKRKQLFDVVETYNLAEVKSTKEYLDFK